MIVAELANLDKWSIERLGETLAIALVTLCARLLQEESLVVTVETLIVTAMVEALETKNCRRSSVVMMRQRYAMGEVRRG